MRPAANSTASSVNLSAEPASYPQISQTRQIFDRAGPQKKLFGAVADSRPDRYLLAGGALADPYLAAQKLGTSIGAFASKPMRQSNRVCRREACRSQEPGKE